MKEVYKQQLHISHPAGEAPHDRYQNIFESMPVPLLEEDFSELYDYLIEKRKNGVTDLRSLFEREPEELTVCAAKVKIINVNRATLELHRAGSKEELLGNLGKIFTDKSYKVFKEEVIALDEGQTQFETEGKVKTLDGEERDVFLHLQLEKTSRTAILVTTDITARKKAEQDVEMREKHLKSLLENPSGYIIYRIRNNRDTGKIDVLQISPSFSKVLGLSDESIKDFQSWFRFVHPEDLSAVLEANLRGMKPPFSFEMEVRYNHPEEGLKWFDIRSKGIPYEDDPENIEYANGLILDITERKRAEELLRKSEEEHRLLTENSIDVIWKMDLNLRFTYVSQSIFQATGYTQEEWIGSSLSEHFTASEYRKMSRKVFDTIKNYRKFKNSVFETIMLKRDGSSMPVEINSKFIFSLMGLPVGLQGAIRDISVRKKAEDELRKSEELYRGVVEDTPVFICSFLPDGEILFVNKACCNFFEKDCEKLIGAGFFDLIPVDERQNVTGKIGSLTVKSPSEKQEHRVVTPKRGKRWLQWIYRGIFDNAGQLTMFQAIGEDITERKDAEERMKNSLEEKQALLRELHHRTKNNMQIICSMMHIKSYKTGDDKLREFVEDIDSRIQSMSIVHQMLYNSDNLSSINLKDYVMELFESLEFRYNLQGNEKIIFIIEGKPIFLLIDIAVPCGLVLTELFSNSIKYAFPDKRKGKIEISMARDIKGDVAIHYSDDGIGLMEGSYDKKSGSMGFELIHLLIESQLKGDVKFYENNGLHCNISFNDRIFNQRIPLNS